METKTITYRKGDVVDGFSLLVGKKAKVGLFRFEDEWTLRLWRLNAKFNSTQTSITFRRKR